MTIKDAETIKATICERIAKGESLRAICDTKGYPAASTVVGWLSEDATFSEQYARAREQQADFYADEIIEIADSEKDAAKARNRIDARKWKASKLQPKKYGDKIDMNVTGTLQHLTDEQLESRVAILLGKAGIGSAARGSGAAEAEA